jgi:hypothetical protein
MPFIARHVLTVRTAVALLAAVVVPSLLSAQLRENRAPAAVQGFAASDCQQNCTLDSLVIDIDRGRRNQPGVVTASLLQIDTIALARRGAPAAPRERAVPVWVSCDSMPCAAAMLSGRLSDKRIDDARVVRRTQLTWPLPAALLQRVLRTTALSVSVDGRTHLLAAPTVAATRALVESVKSGITPAPYSARMHLYVATFALFGVPGDSVMSEDVGTATEPLMMPDANTAMPTRVATLTLVGRGTEAMPLLVQDDATGAAPIFGVNEKVTVVLPSRTGRRGVVTTTVLARQRVDAMRDACQGTKVWTYLVSMAPADLMATQRGMIASPRPAEGIDRWNGTAVREPVSARVTPVEQRAITAGRSAVALFVKERAESGVRASDVQVLAALPRNGGVVTNFGTFTKDPGGTWHFPTLTLRQAPCP